MKVIYMCVCVCLYMRARMYDPAPSLYTCDMYTASERSVPLLMLHVNTWVKLV